MDGHVHINRLLDGGRASAIFIRCGLMLGQGTLARPPRYSHRSQQLLFALLHLHAKLFQAMTELLRSAWEHLLFFLAHMVLDATYQLVHSLIVVRVRQATGLEEADQTFHLLVLFDGLLHQIRAILTPAAALQAAHLGAGSPGISSQPGGDLL